MRHWLTAICLVAALAAAGSRAGSTHASGEDPDLTSAALACDLGAFLTHMRADGTRFTSTADCARYVERGGTLYPLLDLHLAVGTDALLCATGCTGAETTRVTIVTGHIPRSYTVRGTAVSLAGFDFSPDSTVTVRYMLDDDAAARSLPTGANGFFRLTGSDSVVVPCFTGGLTFTVTDDATGLVRTITPDLYC